MALTGNETLQVQGVDNLGRPSGSLETVTTSQIGVSSSGQNTGYTGQQWAKANALTPGATVSWNLNTNQAATLLPIQSFTLSNPTNQQNGATYTLTVTQDASGSRVITWGNAYIFPGGAKFVLSTSANAKDLISFYSDGTNMWSVGQQGFA